MESTSPALSSINDKGSLAPLIDEEVTVNSKIKPLYNVKIANNEKFGKIGQLLSQSTVVGKAPVLDILNGSYPNESDFSDYHRPCNCTKSYCLKLYCECFARDKLCMNCNCNNCMNNLSHEKSRSTALLRILDKNPLAFLPKIGSGQGQKLHRKGCNCKRSECLKNYCECREAKIECSLLCRCQGCKNRPNEIGVPGSETGSIEVGVLDPDDFKGSNVYKSHCNPEEKLSDPTGSNEITFDYPSLYDNPVVQEHSVPPDCHSVSYSTNNVEDYVKRIDSFKKMSEETWPPNGTYVKDEVGGNPPAKQQRTNRWPSQTKQFYYNRYYSDPYHLMKSKLPGNSGSCDTQPQIMSGAFNYYSQLDDICSPYRCGIPTLPPSVLSRSPSLPVGVSQMAVPNSGSSISSYNKYPSDLNQHQQQQQQQQQQQYTIPKQQHYSTYYQPYNEHIVNIKGKSTAVSANTCVSTAGGPSSGQGVTGSISKHTTSVSVPVHSNNSDHAEVTSTNEIEPTTMMKDTPDNGANIIKSEVTQQSSRILSCYKLPCYNVDNSFTTNNTSAVGSSNPYSSSANCQYLPSLFNSGCDNTNRLPYHPHKSSHFTSKSGYLNNSNESQSRKQASSVHSLSLQAGLPINSNYLSYYPTQSFYTPQSEIESNCCMKYTGAVDMSDSLHQPFNGPSTAIGSYCYPSNYYQQQQPSQLQMYNGNNDFINIMKGKRSL